MDAGDDDANDKKDDPFRPKSPFVGILFILLSIGNFIYNGYETSSLLLFVTGLFQVHLYVNLRRIVRNFQSDADNRTS